jgi:hypothetical protein
MRRGVGNPTLCSTYWSLAANERFTMFLESIDRRFAAMDIEQSRNWFLLNGLA